MTLVTDARGGWENHAGVAGEAVMTFPLLVLCFLGSFYTVFGLVVVRRAIQPSCRNCLYWHDCSLSAQLGRPSLPSERCVTHKSEL